MKRGVDVWALKIFWTAWSSCIYGRPWVCKAVCFHGVDMIISLLRLQVKSKIKWLMILRRSFLPMRKLVDHMRLGTQLGWIQMPCWWRNPFCIFGQQFQELFLFPFLLHFLQSSEPFLQESNGRTNRVGITILPTHWKGKGFGVGDVCWVWSIFGFERPKYKPVRIYRRRAISYW